jgi:hypothetical protein
VTFRLAAMVRASAYEVTICSNTSCAPIQSKRRAGRVLLQTSSQQTYVVRQREWISVVRTCAVSAQQGHRVKRHLIAPTRLHRLAGVPLWGRGLRVVHPQAGVADSRASRTGRIDRRVSCASGDRRPS